MSKGTALTPPYLSVNARSTGPVLLRCANKPVSRLLQEVGDVEVVVARSVGAGRCGAD